MATGLGIDVGAESIKVVQARVSAGAVTVTGALKIPRGGGQVLDAPEEETGATVVPETLGQELKRAGLSRSGCLGISGREVILKYLSTPPMPPEKLKMFIDMEIGGKLTARATASDGPAVTYDFRLLNIPSGLKGDLVIMAGVCKNEYLFGVNAALKKAKIDARRITPSCFGLVNAYLRTQKVPEKETVVLVDIGHELLEIAILEENHLYFARSAPGGGKRFSAAIDKVLKMGPEKATAFKHERARIYPEGAQIPSKQDLAFQTALKEGADSIAGAIRSSVMFCRTQAKLPKLDYQRIFISGGGARLTGLKDYLEKKAGRPVQVLDLYAGLDLRKLDAASARCFEGEISDMTVALGLAVIDADPNAFHFSLVPEKVVKRRIFWRKTVFGAAAGVVLMAGMYPAIGSSGRALDDAGARVELIESKKKDAAAAKKAFARRVEENQAQTRRVEYYARQTRMNQIYLGFFQRVRGEMPADITLNYLGPPSDQTTGGTGGPGFGTWSGSEEAVRNFVVRGRYDPAAYPGTKFNETWDALRKKLLEVPGVTKAELEPLPESEAVAKTGERLFQLNIGLQDPVKPLLPNKPEAPAPATAEAVAK